MVENNSIEINSPQSTDVVDDYGQYHVDNQLEMCSILKSLMLKPDVITAYYDDTMQNFILTSVLAVDTKKRNFILDISSDETRNNIFVNSNRVICKTKCKNVRVEFSIMDLKATKLNDENAFLCPLPQNILYLQRREFYRAAIPLGDKISCRILGSQSNPSKSLTLSDISSGGIGLNEPNKSTSYELFEQSKQCEIDFGELGTINFAIELRSIKNIKLNNNSEVKRLGYKFVDLHTPDNAIIQRYIHSIDIRKKQSK
ncbi:hypothetical protein MNBD_GAMMA22-29 [hydrothermal vent metagenome]|uniref:Flagellar brake protein YcgR n=1 Tax=hydrothermal vent metagenome TaxID=652676 RepID=A0A3B0ZU97_9ZZZZ